MLSSVPGLENLSPAIKYLIAFVIIFALLALFAVVLRRLTGGRLTLANQGGRARQPRLGIVDVYDLDRQRQLILLRRDNVEHLLLVGGPNDVVVETNIVRGTGARALPTPAEAPDRADAPPEPRTAELPAARPVVDAPSGRPGGRPGENVIAGHLGRAESAPVRAVARATAGTSNEPAQRSPATVAPAPRPERQLRVAPSPTPAPVRTALNPTPGRTPGPRPVTTPTPAREAPAGEARGRDEDSGAALSDMARQLEDALRRPPEQPGNGRATEPSRANSSPQRPPRSEPIPLPAAETGGRPQPPRESPPRQSPSERPPNRPPLALPILEPAPVAPPPPTPAPVEQDVAPAPVEPPPPPPPPPPRPVPQPTPPRAPPPVEAEPLPEPQPAPKTPEPAPAPEPSPSPPQVPRPDPFSIEDIEAEFARLLGRPLDRKDKN